MAAVSGGAFQVLLWLLAEIVGGRSPWLVKARLWPEIFINNANTYAVCVQAILK